MVRLASRSNRPRMPLHAGTSHGCLPKEQLRWRLVRHGARESASMTGSRETSGASGWVGQVLRCLNGSGVAGEASLVSHVCRVISARLERLEMLAAKLWSIIMALKRVRPKPPGRYKVRARVVK